MAKYRKKPEVVEATQWFRQGDHKQVTSIDGDTEHFCPKCPADMSSHGAILTKHMNRTVFVEIGRTRGSRWRY